MREHEHLVAKAGATPQPVSPALCAAYHRAVELIGQRWMGAILYLLLQRPLRFSELRAALPGISDRLLTERLRELEAEGLADRHVIASSPVRVEYELTETGRDLHGVADAIEQWAHKWLVSE